MIIRSKIEDASKLTLDCAKATLTKGSKVEIDDRHWAAKEVQDAIKLNMIELVGEPPVLPEEPAQQAEKMVRLRNVHGSKITLECIKDYGNPGEIILVPTSKMNELEVRNAISWGMLINEDAPAPIHAAKGTIPLNLEELTTKDILTGTEVPLARPKLKAEGAIKAKKIGSVSAAEESDDSEPQDDGMFKPSEVLIPSESKKAKREMPKAEELDIFGEE